MSSHSMAIGDPYCPIHGISPCRCWYNRQFYFTPTLYQPYNPMLSIMMDICSGCGKHPSVCMCKSSSDPYNDIQYQATLPEGTSICIDPSKPQEVKPVKKWADECRETAQKAKKTFPPEPRSLYIYMLERCKHESNDGHFVKNFYWPAALPVWSKEELEMAADLLREDNFTVELVQLEYGDNDLMVRISWA